MRTPALFALAVCSAVFAAGCATDAGDEDDDSNLPEESADLEEAASTSDLLVNYDLTKQCNIHINYPKSGVVANQTWLTSGTRITWRYNVNGDWALVSDPKRAGKTYPWWGFIQRDCIKDEPSKTLQGRSNVAKSGWRSVGFVTSGAPIVAKKKTINNSTLRDEANFVIGNVPDDWTVEVTNKTRSNGHWVLVHVPNAQRWGWIEASSVK